VSAVPPGADTSPAPHKAHRGRLFRKYLLLILSLVSVGLLASGGISVYFAYRENTAALASLQHEKAIGASSRIEQYLRHVSQQLSYAALPQIDAADLELRRVEFLKLLRQAPEVTDISMLDATGREQIAVSRLGMDVVASGKDRSQEAAFVNAKPGQPWYGPVYFRKETEPYMTVALRSGGAKGPVTVAELNLKFIWDVVSRIKIGDKGKAYVVDQSGLLVADPDIGLVLRKTSMAELAHVKAAAGVRSADEPAMQSRDLAGTKVLTSMAPIDPVDWQVFVEQPVAEVYAKLNDSILLTLGLLLSGLVVSALAAGALARSMVRPIRTLDEGAKRIGAGDLDQQIVVRTGDELEGLADQFNRMSGQLRESYAGLERKVEQRTAEVREALDYQTAISEVLRVIGGSPTDVTPVFEAIMDSAQRLFGTTIGGVFHYDGRMVHLVATRGWSSEALQDASRLYPAPPNPATLNGRVILSCQAQTIADTHADPDYDRTTVQLSQWRRMVGAPMVKDGLPIGAIVVAWGDPGEVPRRQADLLKTFADQAVIAIENVRLFNETREALERQTATAEILKVISESPTDTQPVFEAIVRSCQRLLGGKAVALTLPNGAMLESVAFASDGQAHGEGGFLKPWPFDHASGAGACILESRVIAVADTTEGAKRFARMRDLALALGYRSALFVPLLRDGKALGCLGILRASTGEFDAKEISLAQTFADQAVIAIQNVRLFNETKEALEQQTATAEVLQVISNSVADTDPVFERILASTERLFECRRTAIFLAPGDGKLHLAAMHGASGSNATTRYPRPFEQTAGPMVIGERRQVYFADVLNAPDVPPSLRLAGQQSGNFSILMTPMVWEGQGVGMITVSREPNVGFNDKELGLLRTFADQAVIAIQNARLFNETKEALEQQTATAEVLKVISGSLSDVQPVLEAVALRSRLLGRADNSRVWLLDGDHLRSMTGLVLDDGSESGRDELMPPKVSSVIGRAFVERRTVHVDDVAALLDSEYPDSRGIQSRHGFRTVLGVPMLRDGVSIGTIGVYRKLVQPFSAAEIRLVETFADQAVIAIENVRLFNETKEALEQQTATAEVLKAISRTTFELDPVLDALIENATRLCKSDRGFVFIREGGEYRPTASYGATPEQLEFMSHRHLTSTSGTLVGRAVQQRQVVQIEDARHDPEYAWEPAFELLGFRTMLGVPMLREGEPIGVVAIWRDQVRPFSERDTQLVTSFADQAVIAIENVRLFREIQDKSRQLEIANQHKSEFLANMSHELRTPLNAIIGFSEVLIERMFGELNEKQDDYLKDIFTSGKHLLSLINDILDLSKIEAGRMELDVENFDVPSALSNAMTLVRERAQRHGITLGLEVEPSIGEMRADERKFKQILLNLLTNAVKFTPDGGRVDVRAKLVSGVLAVAVTDTGIGIAKDDQAAVFEEFKQVGRHYTNKQEGTGLGLALTKRFVELHGGTLTLDSEPGKGSTFTFTLPSQP
jgi:signal transduction histidine kinase